MENKRVAIDQVDKEIRALFIQRMNIAKEIGEIKKKKGIAIEDKERETAMIEKNIQEMPENLKPYYKELLEKLVELSKKYQNNL